MFDIQSLVLAVEKQVLHFARIFGDVRRFEQTRDDRDALCASSNNTIEIFEVDPADAEDWQIHVRMNLFDR